MKKIYNIIITSNSGDFYKSISISYRRWKIIRALLIIFFILLIVSTFFYGRLYLLALKARALEVENQALREENKKIKELEARLYKLEEIRVKLYKMLGIDKTPSFETLQSSTSVPTAKTDSQTNLATQSNISSENLNKEDLKKLSKEFEEQSKILFDEERFIPKGLPTKGYISQLYGDSHKGIDIVTPIGSLVVAPADGIVKDIYNDRYLGLTLVLSHGTKYETTYGHLKEVLVKNGQIIKRGDPIALTGNSGVSTGPHLHYQIKYLGRNIDPSNYIYIALP